MGDYRPSYSGVGQMLKAPFMVEAMRARAEVALQIAQSVASEHDKTGEFFASLSADAHDHGGYKHDRAVGLVKSTDPHALSKEFGHYAGPRDENADAEDHVETRTKTEGIHALGAALGVLGE